MASNPQQSQPLSAIARFDDEERDRIRARLRALTRRRLPGDGRRASVLVPLCLRDGAPSVLFTKRTETVGTHKGQVSFPGGRVDPDDTDEVHTALRELQEELGVASAAVEVLGSFHEVMSITAVRVTPVIGFLGELDLESLTPAPAEIDDVFALRLDQLVDPRKREVRLLGTRKAPFFTAGPHPVWGLTAYILDELLRDVLGFDLPPL